MPFYHKLGKIPAKRHTTFFKPDGESLYREELFSTKVRRINGRVVTSDLNSERAVSESKGCFRFGS